MNIKLEEKNKGRNPPKKVPRKITQTYLHNAGLFYLQRFSASSGHFREVLLRKVRRSCLHHTDQDFEKCTSMVDLLVKTFQDSGLLNDSTYTNAMVTSLRRRGKSKRAIFSYLTSKSLPPDIIKKELQSFDLETAEDSAQAELKAALIFARKKRFGPYARDKDENTKKALGSMARAGFSYDTIQSVLKIKENDFENYDTNDI